MSKALIAYQNLLATGGATITASSSRPGFSAPNAWDWRTTTYWSPAADGVQTLTAVFPSPVTADYFALYRHNLATAEASVVLQASDDSGATWDAVITEESPADNELLLKTFAPLARTHWRVLLDIAGADPCYLGVLMLGTIMPLYRGMPPGFTPPHQSRRSDVMNSTTDGGQFAGRSIIKRGATTTITVRSVPPAWVRDVWQPFQLHAERLPFLFSWNHVYRPGDACWCESDGEFPAPGPIDENYRQTITLPVRCLLSGVD